MTVLGDAQFHQKICLQVVGVPEESQPFGTKAMERIRGEDRNALPASLVTLGLTDRHFG